jgi:glycosyltransferase involved in cell wall biosynthesis
MKFSIVTPSFNQGQFIERTLQSVAAQRSARSDEESNEQSGAPPEAQVEHVVFDGGSSDGTVEILRACHSELRWVSEPDGGQASAVNRGICATDGEVIGWLNSDDIYYPGAVARVAAFLHDHPEVDVVYGDADHIDTEDRAFEAYPTQAWNFERLKETCFICQPALFLRRRIIERLGLLDETLHYCMDYEYWLRLGQAGVRFAHLGQKLAGSRMYDANKTLGARRNVHREINDMMKSKFGRVPDRWIYNYAHVVVEETCTRQATPAQLARRIALGSLASALRWNGRPSAAMCRTTARWIAASLWHASRADRAPHV